MSPFEPAERTRLRRIPERAVFDRSEIEAILDEGYVCHVGFVDDGAPFVIPTVYARDGERLLLHGSQGSRMLRVLEKGGPACVTVTLIDGLVLARSLFHHSMNYRSVVVLGRGREITGEAERLRSLRVLSDQIVPGRWAEARAPNERELAQTLIVAIEIDELSAKVRSGPPGDEEEDYDLPHWAGVLPLRQVAGEPVPDPRLEPGIAVPASVAGYQGGARS